MIELRSNTSPKKLPVWTPLLVFLIIFIGTLLSLLAKHNISVSEYFLPTAFSVVLIYWLGPKLVVPVVYINSVSTSYLWGNPVEDWPLWFLYGIPETLFAFLSWLLFRKLYRGKYWLPDTQNTVLFLVVGISVPLIIEVFLLQSMLVWTGAQSQSTFWLYTASNLISEFTTSFFITFPALYFITPWLKKINILQDPPQENIPTHIPRKSVILKLSVIFACLLGLIFLIEFQDYWYIYGFFSLYVAIRFGFGPAILTNFYIFVITYILPKLFPNFGKINLDSIEDVFNIFLGACLLSIFSALTGRVISDIKIAELKLKHQNVELEKVNEELDRFVYSVSHDLTAPLKSILGLVNISRLTNDHNVLFLYLGKIEKSVKKLETFIGEILDYSRNKRQQLVVEPIDIKELVDELLENLSELPEAKSIQVHFQLHEPEIYQDRMRLKIILANLLSNAVKFQNSYTGHQSYVKISSFKNCDDFQIEIEDNGIGIREEQLESIFQMFYRGQESSQGSGLGLYIAKEAMSKINGRMTVKSEYGKGSTFILSLKDLTDNASLERK